MRRRLAIGLATVMLAACGGADDGERGTTLVFGTGGTSGTYYPIGGALKTVFEQDPLIDSVQVVSTGGSVANVRNLQQQLNQLAIVMSDVAYEAAHGSGAFDGNPVPLQAIAGLYPNVVQVVATAGSGIRSIADLRGRRVSVGQPGSGVEQSALKVLEAAALDYDDLSRVVHSGYADSVTEMQNGNLDAAFFTSGVPNSNITSLIAQMDVRVLPVDGELAQRLLERYPYYETYRIPGGDPARYDLPEPVQTVAIRNLLCVSPQVPDAVATAITSRLYDYLGSDAVAIGALRSIDRGLMSRNLVVPLHPGAATVYSTP